MSLSKTFIAALGSLTTNKMRSFLTMLGIIIGVAAVIILVSLMGGLTTKITDTFSEFGTNTITVTVKDRGGSRKLPVKDMYDFVDKNSDILSGVTPKVTISGTVKSGTENITTSVTGVSEQDYDIAKLSLKSGRFLQYIDMANIKKVCVIGTYIEKDLFGTESAMGKTIKINGYPYQVVGVLTEEAGSEQGSSDEVIYIPYTTATKLAGTTSISSYTVSMVDEDQSEMVVTKLKAFLDEKLGDSDYYSVMAMQEILDEINSTMGILQSVLVCIAGISLLVGGIGIMNIMLVSVTERTREIGIRKSLGAKKKFIMRQFIMEASTVSGIGGVLGIALGIGLSLLGGKLLGLTVVPSTTAIIVSFCVSVGIGIMFGFLPANKAAKLNPIDALRYD